MSTRMTPQEAATLANQCGLDQETFAEARKLWCDAYLLYLAARPETTGHAPSAIADAAFHEFTERFLKPLRNTA